MKKITIIITIAAAAGLVFYMVKGKQEKTEKRADIAKDAEDVKELEQKVLSFSIDGRTPKGVRQWHLEGKAAEIIEEDIHFDDLRAVAYGEDVTVNLMSDSGVYSKKKGEVSLIGNVKVVSDDGSVLTTETAKWSQNTKEISSDDIIRIERENMIAVGRGGMANSSEKIAMLKRDVSVEIKPDTKVRSDGPLKVDHADNVAVFSDNVMVKDKDGRMFADKLTVYIDPETRKIGKVIAEGNVKVKRGRSYTISEKAIYTESTKSAKLIGKPRIIIDPEELKDLENLGGQKD